MFLSTLVIIIAVLGVTLLVLSRSDKEKSASWFRFYAKGKEAGFSFKEIEMLRSLAVKSGLEDPLSLFYSQNQLDLCIRAMVRGMRLSGGGDEQGSQDFLSRLYDYRQQIAIDEPEVKNDISDSRQIGGGQALRVLVPGSGVYKSRVIKNTNQYITISRPSGNTPASGTLSWGGLKISVYFWREDDAGYVFDSEVLDEVYSKGLASLKIAHAETLFRTQERKSVRVKIHKSAFLYLLADDEEADKLEVNPGLKCFLEDLSDTGCAVTVGGKAENGLRIKVQFAMNNAPIVMGGTVRHAEYTEEDNRSLLHIEADPLPTEIRNHILGEVFGMLPEKEEDLPFRLLDEEASGMVLAEDRAVESAGEAL